MVIARRWLAALLLAVTTPAAANVSYSFGGGTLSVVSDAADALAVSCVAGVARVNATSTGVACTQVVTLIVLGGPGANAIDLSSVAAANFPAITLVSVVGSGGADSIVGSALDDTIQWGPGAGNDVVDGGGGTDDTLIFTGDDNDEVFVVEANGARARVTRNIGSVVLDIDLERVILNLRGGNDLAFVNPTVGTALLRVDVSLVTATNQADAASDNIYYAGTPASDRMTLFAYGSELWLRPDDGAPLLDITGVEQAYDLLTIAAGESDDDVSEYFMAQAVAPVRLELGPGYDSVGFYFAFLPGANTFMAAPVPGGFKVNLAGANVATVLGTYYANVVLGDGNDTFTAEPGFNGDIVFTVNGEDGNDVLVGTAAYDQIYGGPDNDTITGGGGDDELFGDEGEDVFRADTGAGQDQVDGGAGYDTLVYRATNFADAFRFGSYGGRSYFTHDGYLDHQLSAVESVTVDLLDGSDDVLVEDLSQGDLSNILLDHAATAGSGTPDGALDLVTVRGTYAADTWSLTNGPASVIVATGDGRTISMPGRGGNDRLTVQGLDGDDRVTTPATVAASAPIDIRLGEGGEIDGDELVVVGEAVPESYAIRPTGPQFRIERILPAFSAIDVVDAERLSLSTGAGDDDLTTTPFAVAQALDGGAPDGTGGADELFVQGVPAGQLASPITLPGSAPIAHANFENVEALPAETFLFQDGFE